MQANPLVSIAINNYNYARFLPEAIDSALNQTYPHVEVIVVDDGSTDDSREVIESYGNKVVAVLKDNGGQASAFNAGFAASRGDIFCFLDADDIFTPDKAEKIVKVFQNNPELGWCFHGLKWVDGEGKPLNQSSGTSGEAYQEYDLRSHIRQGKLKDQLPDLPSTTGLCFTRWHLEQILPMPVASRIGLNDGYLEFTSIGLSKGAILNQELALYRVHGSNAYSQRNDKQKVQARIILLTAYWIRQKFPDLAKFTNNMLATGLGMSYRSGGIAGDCQELVKKYFKITRLRQRMEIYLRAAYNYFKNTQFQ